MLIFSAKARQVIDYAVATFGDPKSKEIWTTWTRAHPAVRRPGGPWHDGKPELPNDVVEAAQFALRKMSRQMREQRERAGLSEDQLSDLENDLSGIKSVERFLTEWRAPVSERHRSFA